MLAARPAISLTLISRLQFTPFHRPALLHSCCAAYTIIMGEDLRDFQKVAVDAAKAAGAIIEAAFHQVSVAWISSAWQAWAPHVRISGSPQLHTVNVWLVQIVRTERKAQSRHAANEPLPQLALIVSCAS